MLFNIPYSPKQWKVVTGCKRHCPYCFAVDHWEHPDNRPYFHPERLNFPAMINPSDRARKMGLNMMHVCPTGEWLAEWIPREWTSSILEVIRQNPQWTYFCVSKSPERFAEIEWPDYCRLAITIDVQSRVDAAESAFRHVKSRFKIAHIEPMLERLTFKNISIFDAVFIGPAQATSKYPGKQPNPEWVSHLLGQARRAKIKVYCSPLLDVPFVKPMEALEGMARCSVRHPLSLLMSRRRF